MALGKREGINLPQNIFEKLKISYTYVYRVFEGLVITIYSLGIKI